MATNWVFLLVIFAFLGIGLSLQRACPNNKTFQCVPRPYCPSGLKSITWYRCSSRSDVCCEERKVYTGMRFTGTKLIPGPYNQGP